MPRFGSWYCRHWDTAHDRHDGTVQPKLLREANCESIVESGYPSLYFELFESRIHGSGAGLVVHPKMSSTGIVASFGGV